MPAKAEQLDAFVELVDALLALVAPESKSRSSRADARFIRETVLGTRRIERIFEAGLTRVFDELGRVVAAAFAGAGKDAGDDLSVALTLSRADVRRLPVAKLRREYEKLYALTGQVVYGAVSQRVGVRVGWSLSDPAARAVVRAGGTRAGLVDLAGDTRTALYAALGDGRERGDGPIELARRVRQYVPAGRFVGLERARAGAGVAYRAELIARTETTYARNISAIAAGTTAGFDSYLVFDARLGPTDADCEGRDGLVVDAEEAARLIAEEHPNGTLSVSPMPRTTGAPPAEPVPAPAIIDREPPAIEPPAPEPAPIREPQPDDLLIREVEDAISSWEELHRRDPVESALVISRTTGRTLLDKSQGAVSRVSFDSSEVVIMRDAVLSHNHPGGRAFSLEDLNMLRAAELHEVRVARRGGGTMAARLTRVGRTLSPKEFWLALQRYDDELSTKTRAQLARGEITYDDANRLHHDRLADLIAERGLILLRRQAARR